MWDQDTSNLKFGGKTDNAQISVKLLYKLTEMFPKDIFYGSPSLCLYGEGIGAGIQKGGGNYIKDGVSFILFDIKVDTWWLKREVVEEVAKDLEIQIVSIVGEGTIEEAIEYTRNGFKSQWGDFTAEGIVLRPKVQLFAGDGSRIITKIKHKDFFIKGGK